MQMIPDGAVLSAFMQDWAMVTILRGPWRSGKSVGCVGKLYMAAHAQLPDRMGVRKTRWVVVRNTYAELQETTIKTWLTWFPEGVYGDLRRSRPFMHMIRVAGQPFEGRPTTIEMEVLFLALDDEDDRKKLLSLEYTGAWVNEGREVEKGIIDDLIGRSECYPSDERGIYCTWGGVIIDTNAPPETHWLPVMMGETPVPDWYDEDQCAAARKPDNWHYYVQPGALKAVKDARGKVVSFEPNPEAENVKYLKGGHQWYLDRVGAKPRSWVLVNFCNQLGRIVQGKAVWPTFERELHVSKGRIPYDPSLILYVGVDSTGRKPAATFGQVLKGRWRILSELIGVDISAERFAPELKRKVASILATGDQTVSSGTVQFWRDPHMQKSAEMDDLNTDMIYMKHGLRLMAAPSGNAIRTRIETVEVLFDNNKILISGPDCPLLVAACEGGYAYRRLKIPSAEIYEDTPDKRTQYADVADSLQYLVDGGGEGRAMVRGSEKPKPVRVVAKYVPREGRGGFTRRRQFAA